MSSYSVAGYVPGDRIGAGIVVDPATITKKEAHDTKLVAVDLNLDGKFDPQQDDQVLVKLPPKGIVPANWQGASKAVTLGEKLHHAGEALVGGTVVGGLAGMLVGFAAGELANSGVVGSVLARNPCGVAVAAGTAVVVGGAAIAWIVKKGQRDEDAQKARESLVPNMIPPKFILNQYLLQQQQAAQLATP